MLATQLSIHDAKVGLVSPTKYVGTLGGVNVNELPAHGTLGTVDGNLLLGIVDVLNIEDGIPRRERRALAKDPALGVEGEEAGLLLRLAAGGYRHGLGLADADGGIASIASDVPPGRHGGPESVEGSLLPVKVGKAAQNSGGRTGHGIVHPATDVVGGWGRRAAVPDCGGPAVQSPVGRGRFGLALVFILGRCEFETYSEHGAGVNLSGGGELPSASGPAIAIGRTGQGVGTAIAGRDRTGRTAAPEGSSRSTPALGPGRALHDGICYDRTV
mmetsp:Transcript_37660/g.82061  ORF Transcript_37660/g.82061 Transcript_37660/m.82061 type:complete len:272 (-) Transcript_37660:209-1024(-)